MSERPAIDDLAAAIADGTGVDWAAAESSAGSERDRGVVRRLRRIGEIAEAQRSRPQLDAEPLAGQTEHEWGHLKLLAKIGEGAFGEIYRAWDTKLDREVALKLLRAPVLGSDSTGSAAVEEGRVLARVRHPNVVAVYGADRTGGRVGIWMDFIRGRTLEQVLVEQGPFSAQEATLVGLDLCEALAAVHAAGFVHRDLKAQNVMREDGGRIVLMDFGTGRERAVDACEPIADSAGTPLYMAPEVLAGGAASMASDVYSLGVLLYHLVTAKFPIAARTLAEVKDAHRSGTRTRLRDVRPDLPEAFVRIVDRAMATQPRARFETLGAMEAALADVSNREPTPRRTTWLPWSLTAALVLALGTTLAVWRPWRRGSADDVVTRFIETADLQVGTGSEPPPFAISPDGSRLAYTALEGETHVLLTRAMNEASPTVVVRSPHWIGSPTFSPDGRSMAFFMPANASPSTQPTLWKTGLDGGPPVALTDPLSFGRGGIAWGSDGAIVFFQGAAPNLWRTTDTGKTPQQVTHFKGSDTTNAFRPQILPDGTVLFTTRQPAGPARSVALLRDGTIKTLIEDADRARFIPPGYLVFSRDQSLMGVRFDLSRLATIGPVVQFGSRSGAGWFDISASGSLVSSIFDAQDADHLMRLFWIARGAHTETPAALPPRRYLGRSLSVSPDGRWVAVAIARDDGNPSSMSPRSTWLGDLERGGLSPFAGDVTQPLAWSPDGRYLVFKDAKGGLSRKVVDGASAEEELVAPGLFANEGTWTPDGRTILLAGSHMLTWRSVAAVGHEPPQRDPTFSLQSKVPISIGAKASFSPDGHWVAYHSADSGQIEVYARAFRGPGPVVRISVNGGQDPRWVGNEIYYREPGTPGRLMSVRVDPRNPSLGCGDPQVVADVVGHEPVEAFDVSPDGQRFLVLRGSEVHVAQLSVVLNWIREVRQKLN